MLQVWGGGNQPPGTATNMVTEGNQGTKYECRGRTGTCFSFQEKNHE